MKSFKDCEFGDDVFDVRIGWGKIIKAGKGEYPFEATFGYDSENYTVDGKLFDSDKYQSCFTKDECPDWVPSRPKSKVKKIAECWVNIYSDHKGCCYHGSETVAKKYAEDLNLIATAVHLTGEYEAEE